MEGSTEFLTCGDLLAHTNVKLSYNYLWGFNDTIMDFSAGVHDVICTRKKILRKVVAKVKFFLVHDSPCAPAEKALTTLLYNQPV